MRKIVSFILVSSLIILIWLFVSLYIQQPGSKFELGTVVETVTTEDGETTVISTTTTTEPSVVETFTPEEEEEPVTITLTLPITPSDIVDEPEYHGILPYGVKVGYNPAGHTGLNFEVKENISIKSASSGVILEISDNVLPEEGSSIIIASGDYKLYYNYVKDDPNSTINLTVGQHISKGQLLGYPCESGTLGFHMLQFGLLDRLRKPLCPDFKYWDSGSQEYLRTILNNSVKIENGEVVGKYDKLCY